MGLPFDLSGPSGEESCSSGFSRPKASAGEGSRWESANFISLGLLFLSRQVDSRREICKRLVASWWSLGNVAPSGSGYLLNRHYLWTSAIGRLALLQVDFLLIPGVLYVFLGGICAHSFRTVDRAR